MLNARVIVAAILGTSVVIATAGRAWSDLPQDPTGGGQNNGGSITIGAGNTGSTGGSGSGNGGSGGSSGNSSGCQWSAQATQGPTNPSQVGGYSEGGSGPPTSVAPTDAGTWYLEVCPGTPGRLIFVPQGQPVVQVITPAQLSVDAKNQINPPLPTIQMSPAADANHWQYVHVPSWLWVPATSWVPLTATAAVPGVVVTATAVPVELDITYTDGGVSHTVACRGPGTPYSDALAAQENPQKPLNAASPDCGWVFQNSSAGQPSEAVPVRAVIKYNASWTVTGAPGGGNLGVVTSPATVFSVRVAEVQALNVPPPGN